MACTSSYHVSKTMIPIKKTELDKRLVYGEVYAPALPDSDGEVMSAETIEKAAHNFLRNMRHTQVDKDHRNDTKDGVVIVESFIARKGDPDFIPGSWVVGVHIADDEWWDAVKSGEINGFSLEAMVHKKDVEIELEVPPVLKGMTTKEEDHEHEFFVTYDAEGNLLGGRTDSRNGHFHMILGGTVTEKSQTTVIKSHGHRFSFVELLIPEDPSAV